MTDAQERREAVVRVLQTSLSDLILEYPAGLAIGNTGLVADRIIAALTPDATPAGSGERELPLPRTVPRFDGTVQFPRRSCVDQRTREEAAVWAVHARIEAMPASPHLTDAVTLIAKAADKVADYLEGAKPAIAPESGGCWVHDNHEPTCWMCRGDGKRDA